MIHTLRRRLVAAWAPSPIDITIPGGACSISFDDVPHSVWEAGKPVLDHYQAKATFYMVGRLVNQPGYLSAEELQTLHAEGHEIASHTWEHHRLGRMSPAALKADLERNHILFDEMLPEAPLKNFSYPCGSIAPWHKRLLAERYTTCRTTIPGLIAGRVDALSLPAFKLYHDTVDWTVVNVWLQEAKALHGWVIFYTHDVSATPGSAGCTPEDLGRLLELAKHNDLPVKPIRDVLP
ncbi:MAG: peptidoglycan/xylan/chitin deacetylase (PgdA/CDA1 family) [Kiritimatiellia bacterium]|jgi:peptidoglycan/xylan/chitin deacetylase (PgdA/CDA1 family)